MILALLALAASAAEPASARLADRIVAVGILAKAVQVDFRPHGSFQAIDQSSGELRTLEAGRLYKVEADAVGGKPRLVFGPHLFGGPARILPGKPGEYVTIGERKYRGNLVFRPNPDATVTVVDELGVEEYLFGVLPHEMSPEWPLEALKAQAVVARTFALNNLGRHGSAGFDLTDDDRSQVYAGLTTESERVKEAVRATAGQTLAYAGRPLKVYFHSTCGGHTSDPAAVWGGPSPKPLKGVRDRWCELSPHYRWDVYFTREDIRAALDRNGVPTGRVDDVREGTRAAAGWLKDVRVKADGIWRRVPANSFRLWLGARDLKSMRLDRIRRRKKGFEFYGRGYGHGVGLCQWGARAQAEKGRDYREILAHYFPGAQVAEE